MLPNVIKAVSSRRARIYVFSPTGLIQPDREHPPLVPPAHHQYFELAICFEGEMSFVGYSNTLALKRGDAVVVKPGAWHYESYRRVTQPYRVCWLVATPRYTNCLFTHYHRRQFSVATSAPRPPHDETASLNDLAREVTTQPLHWREKSRAMLVQLLADFDRQPAQTVTPRQQPDPVRTLLRIAQARFRDPLQIKSIAKEVGLSPDHLSRRFFTTCGTTFKDYLNEIRVHHAQQLLKSGWSIKRTAAECGFSDVYYFSRVFKERCGTTPGKFLQTSSTPSIR